MNLTREMLFLGIELMISLGRTKRNQIVKIICSFADSPFVNKVNRIQVLESSLRITTLKFC